MSVVMSAYNAERHVGTAVESILGQTFSDFELVAIDDGSRDRTGDILAAYGDPRIHVLRQVHRGLIASLNRGIGLASGEYIARMDADDVAHPRRLERQVAFLDVNHDVGMVGTAYDEIDEQGRVIGHRRYPTEDGALRRALIRYNPFFHSSVMMRRGVLEAVGSYDGARSFLVEDYDLWFRVARVTRMANLPDTLMQRRYGTHNISLKRESEQLRQAIRLRWRVLRRGDYPPWSVIFLLRPLAVGIMPARVRTGLRRSLLGSRI